MKKIIIFMCLLLLISCVNYPTKFLLVSEHFEDRGIKVENIAPLPSPAYGSFLVRGEERFWYIAINDFGGIRVIERIEFY